MKGQSRGNFITWDVLSFMDLLRIKYQVSVLGEVIDSDVQFFFFPVGEVSCPEYQFPSLYKNSDISSFFWRIILMVHCRDLVGGNCRHAFNIKVFSGPCMLCAACV